MGRTQKILENWLRLYTFSSHTYTQTLKLIVRNQQELRKERARSFKRAIAMQSSDPGSSVDDAESQWSMVPDGEPDAETIAYRRTCEGVRQFTTSMKLMDKHVYNKAVADAKKTLQQQQEVPGSPPDTLLAAASAAAAPT